MPEYPDITIYLEHLRELLTGRRLERIRLRSPFLLRSVDPPIREAEAKQVRGFRRIGKRIVFELEDGLYLVLHLMIAGRLRWQARAAKPGKAASLGKIGLASFEFDNGSLVLTEASTKKRAALHLVRGEAGLAAHDPGGLEVLDADLAAFRDALARENHTLKRSLTDPHLFSGIGNAYSDEILHRARLSPVKLSTKLDDDEVRRLYEATRDTLVDWADRLRRESAGRFPEKVTAFRQGMAVHGRHRQPCPDCGSPVQRIAYAENETNYCARCQTGGKLLADRSLSRLMKDDWPRTLEDLEEIRRR